MITSLYISNFRSIQDLTLSLGPLTVLVGPNGAGKSTVLTALDPGVNLSPSFRHENVTIFIERSFEDGYKYATKSLPGQRQTHLNSPRSYSHQVLRLELDKLRQANQLQSSPMLAASGSNLANTFGTLPRRVQATLAAELCRLVPAFSDVDLTPDVSQAGLHRLRFYDRWKPDVTYHPAEVSDGTMLLLAYLLLRYQQTPPDVLAIEEPERGLHPYLLRQLVTFLRGLTKPSDPSTKPIQIVMATHSAELLEHLEPSEVRFLSRSPTNGNVTVREIDTSTQDWAQAYKEYDESLGGIWLSGGVGGVPGK